MTFHGIQGIGLHKHCVYRHLLSANRAHDRGVSKEGYAYHDDPLYVQNAMAALLLFVYYYSVVEVRYILSVCEDLS